MLFKPNFCPFWTPVNVDFSDVSHPIFLVSMDSKPTHLLFFGGYSHYSVSGLLIFWVNSMLWNINTLFPFLNTLYFHSFHFKGKSIFCNLSLTVNKYSLPFFLIFWMSLKPFKWKNWCLGSCYNETSFSFMTS